MGDSVTSMMSFYRPYTAQSFLRQEFRGGTAVYRHSNPAENTCWSQAEGLVDKKRMVFSSGFTKKLEEPIIHGR